MENQAMPVHIDEITVGTHIEDLDCHISHSVDIVKEIKKINKKLKESSN